MRMGGTPFRGSVAEVIWDRLSVDVAVPAYLTQLGRPPPTPGSRHPRTGALRRDRWPDRAHAASAWPAPSVAAPCAGCPHRRPRAGYRGPVAVGPAGRGDRHLDGARAAARGPAGGGRPARGCRQPWPEPGAVVAVRDPRLPSRILIKRVSAVDRQRGTLEVIGDDPRVEHRQPDVRPGAAILAGRSGGLPVRPSGPERPCTVAGGVRSGVMPSPRDDLDRILTSPYLDGIDDPVPRRHPGHAHRVPAGRGGAVLPAPAHPGPAGHRPRLPRARGVGLTAGSGLPGRRPSRHPLRRPRAPARTRAPAHAARPRHRGGRPHRRARRRARGRRDRPPWSAWTPTSSASLAGRLESLENRVSLERRALHVRIDTLQAELVARHKTGRASVDGLLS